MSRIVTLAVGITLCMVLSACGGKDEPQVKDPDYTPIADKELFSQIGELPGVISVKLKFRDTFESGDDYVGTVEVGPDADPAAVLDQTLAILRQGRYRASMTVVTVQDGRQTSPDALGLKSTIDRRLTERYGPQPGDGKPPASMPTP